MTTADAKLRIGADVAPAKRALSDLGKTVNQTGGSVGGFNTQLKTGQERIEKLATAVTGTSSVLGGMGAKAGAAAGAVSNLATAFLAGGPLLAGLALATTAAAILGNHLLDAKEAAENLAQANREALKRSFDETKEAADGAARAVRDFGKTANKIAQEEAQREIDRLEVRKFGARNIQSSLLRVTGGLRAGAARRGVEVPSDPIKVANLAGSREFQKMLGISPEDGRAIEEMGRQAAESAAIIQDSNKLLELRRKQLADIVALGEKEKEAVAKKKAEREAAITIKDTGSDVVNARTRQGIGEARLRAAQARESKAQAGRDSRGDDLRWAFEQQDAEQKAAKKHAKEMAKVDAAKEKERNKIAKEAADERQRIAKEEMATVHELASQTMGFLASVSMQLFDQTLDVIEQLAAGQEVAFAKLAAGFIRSIGTQITGIGLRSTAEGLALAATLLMPGGQVNAPAVAAHLAIGTTLTGVGAQMAVGGAVTQGLLSRNGGGGGGGALGGGSLSPRESSGGGGQGFSGSGDITINFNGGTQLGDPTERAVRLARDQRRAGRNVYIPPGT